MPTRMKAQRRQRAAERRKTEIRCGASEMMLRRNLAQRHKIRGVSDDRGLCEWLASMITPTEDSRTAWEKQLHERLKTNLEMAS